MGDADRPEQPPVLPWERARAADPGSVPTGAAGAEPRGVVPPPAPTPPPAQPRAGAPLVTAASAIAAGLPYRGDLAADSPLRLLYLVAAASASGRLDLLTERGRFVLHFRRGVLESAASDAAADSLGAHLLRKGAVSAEALGRAEALRDRFAGDLVSALVSFDAFRPARDLALLQEHGVLVVTQAIATGRGTSEWAPGVAAAAPGFPLASRWGLVCEAARRLEPDTARALLGDRVNRAATRTRGRVELAELKLMPQEARAASLLDGRTTIAQLLAARALDAATVLRTAFLLVEAELLQFGELVAAGPSATPLPPRAAIPAPQAAVAPTSPKSAGTPQAAVAPPPPKAAVPAPQAAARPGASVASPAGVVPPSPVAPAKAAPPAPPAEDRASLEAFHAKLDGADHFAVLGAKRNATAAQLKSSYFQLAKRYHPDAGAPGEPPEWKKLRADIFARIGEAWAVLGNDQARADYLAELTSNAGPPVDVAHIVQAEELFRKATILIRARQYPQGLTALEQAIQVNPDEPEFHIWLAWTRFLVARDRTTQRSVSGSAIEAALEKAPRCAYGYLFLAQMARITGDMAGAERSLKRGLAAAPNHEELARELKFIEQKHPRK